MKTINLGPYHELPRNERIHISSGTAGDSYLVIHAVDEAENPQMEPTPFTKQTPFERAHPNQPFWRGIKRGRGW